MVIFWILITRWWQGEVFLCLCKTGEFYHRDEVFTCLFAEISASHAFQSNKYTIEDDEIRLYSMKIDIIILAWDKQWTIIIIIFEIFLGLKSSNGKYFQSRGKKPGNSLDEMHLMTLQ